MEHTTEAPRYPGSHGIAKKALLQGKLREQGPPLHLPGFSHSREALLAPCCSCYQTGTSEDLVSRNLPCNPLAMQGAGGAHQE